MEQRQQPGRRRLVRADQRRHDQVDLTGWRMNDNHASFAAAVALEGVTSLAPGHSAVFVERHATKADAFDRRLVPGRRPRRLPDRPYAARASGSARR